MLQFFINTITSGLAFDFMKIITKGTKNELVLKLKDTFREQPFLEEDYNNIAEIMRKIEERDLKNESYFKAYLESSEELKEILKDKKPVESVYQKTYGDGSHNFKDIYGDINFNYGVDFEKK